MRLVIAQWLYSSECWVHWKEIGPGWYIVGDKRRLVPSVPDRRHFVKVTCACTVADCSPSVHLPPACLSVFQFLNRLGKHSLSSTFIKSPLLYEWMHCTRVGVLLKALQRLEKLSQRLLCAIDIKVATWYKDTSPFVLWKWDINLQMGFYHFIQEKKPSLQARTRGHLLLQLRWTKKISRISLLHLIKIIFFKCVHMQQLLFFYSQSNWSLWRHMWIHTRTRTPTRPSWSLPLKSTPAT